MENLIDIKQILQDLENEQEIIALMNKYVEGKKKLTLDPLTYKNIESITSSYEFWEDFLSACNSDISGSNINHIEKILKTYSKGIVKKQLSKIKDSLSLINFTLMNNGALYLPKREVDTGVFHPLLISEHELENDVDIGKETKVNYRMYNKITQKDFEKNKDIIENQLKLTLLIQPDVLLSVREIVNHKKYEDYIDKMINHLLEKKDSTKYAAYLKQGTLDIRNDNPVDIKNLINFTEQLLDNYDEEVDYNGEIPEKFESMMTTKYKVYGDRKVMGNYMKLLAFTVKHSILHRPNNYLCDNKNLQTVCFINSLNRDGSLLSLPQEVLKNLKSLLVKTNRRTGDSINLYSMLKVVDGNIQAKDLTLEAIIDLMNNFMNPEIAKSMPKTTALLKDFLQKEYDSRSLEDKRILLSSILNFENRGVFVNNLYEKDSDSFLDKLIIKTSRPIIYQLSKEAIEAEINLDMTDFYNLCIHIKTKNISFSNQNSTNIFEVIVHDIDVEKYKTKFFNTLLLAIEEIVQGAKSSENMLQLGNNEILANHMREFVLSIEMDEGKSILSKTNIKKKI